jgi:hypothetical protein
MDVLGFERFEVGGVHGNTKGYIATYTLYLVFIVIDGQYFGPPAA